MQTITDLQQWQTLRASLDPVLSIGFVPTMGCLHAGHASLIQRSISENDLTILSLFVNPTQFNDPHDYDAYPKTQIADLALATQLGVHYTLIPTESSLYPNHNTIQLSTKHPITESLEGKYRPNHFNGVLTIVMKLLTLVSPTRVYVGEKDYQQYKLIETMVSSYFIPTQVIACPTIREASGLPCSSRNQRLSSAGKQLAEQFSKIFQTCTPDNLIDKKTELKNLGIQIEYLETDGKYIFVAVYIDSVRLIDHIPMGENSHAC